jgi:hypothetical protein
MIDIEIDKLTNSIENAISGDSFETELTLLEKIDIKNISKRKGWLFDWTKENNYDDREVYKLYIKGNSTVIQGLVSVTKDKGFYEMHLIENAPFNKGSSRLYLGVAGNLVAFVCKLSLDEGFDGVITFKSKTQLMQHYHKTLGAEQLAGQRMVIYPDAALKLIQKYFRL